MSPLFSVTKGHPSSEELAALATVVAAHATAQPATPQRPQNSYGRPVDKFNTLPRTGLHGVHFA